MPDAYSLYIIFINTLTPIVSIGFLYILPFIGIYISYTSARSLHIKSIRQNYAARTLQPAVAFAITSFVSINICVVLAQLFLNIQCNLSQGDCSSIGILTFIYGLWSIPVSIALFFVGISNFSSVSTIPDVNYKKDNKYKNLSKYPALIVILTIVIYLPAGLISKNVNQQKIEEYESKVVSVMEEQKNNKIALAKIKEYVCSVSANEISRSLVLTTQEDKIDVHYTMSPNRRYAKSEYIGEIQGDKFLYKNPKIYHDFRDCLNAYGEDFSKKFTITQE